MVASISACLNKIDSNIFDKSSKNPVESDLEDIRDHIEWKQADVVCRGKDDDKEKMLVLSVLSQINNIIERFYWNAFKDTEEEFDGHYNDLRRKLLECYELIDLSLKIINLYEYEKKSIT